MVTLGAEMVDPKADTFLLGPGEFRETPNQKHVQNDSTGESPTHPDLVSKRKKKNLKFHEWWIPKKSLRI